MDKDQAVREVQEIKQIMEDSRKRSGRGKYWIGPAIALLAMAVCGLVPVLTPIIAIGLIVGGAITWHRASEPIMKAIAAGVLAIGIVLLILTLFVILGIMGFQTYSTTTTSPMP